MLDWEGLSGTRGGSLPYHTDPLFWFSTYLRPGSLPNPAEDRVMAANEGALLSAGFLVTPDPILDGDPWHVLIGGNLIVDRKGSPNWTGNKTQRAATASLLKSLFDRQVWP